MMPSLNACKDLFLLCFFLFLFLFLFSFLIFGITKCNCCEDARTFCWLFWQNNGKKVNIQKIRVAVVLCKLCHKFVSLVGVIAKLKASNHAYHANINLKKTQKISINLYWWIFFISKSIILYINLLNVKNWYKKINRLAFFFYLQCVCFGFCLFVFCVFFLKSANTKCNFFF